MRRKNSFINLSHLECIAMQEGSEYINLFVKVVPDIHDGDST